MWRHGMRRCGRCDMHVEVLGTHTNLGGQTVEATFSVQAEVAYLRTTGPDDGSACWELQRCLRMLQPVTYPGAAVRFSSPS
jgi:hypothetical protein